MALAKRLGISIQEMKEMSFTSLLNILLANIESNTSVDDVREATQEDINRIFV